MEQAESFVLDAELSQYCEADAKKHCTKELEKAKMKGSDEAGEVFSCLVDNLMRKTVSATSLSLVSFFTFTR